MAFDHAKAKADYEALPIWARRLVDGMQKSISHGIGLDGLDQEAVTIGFRDDDAKANFFRGMCGLRDFAAAVCAPDPSQMPPSAFPELAVNIVEWVADPDGCAWDQPCRFGHRVETHVVYCHNTAWPMASSKCRRGKGCAEIYGIPENRHEDCPGYAPNPLFEGAL
jgi:hypothetical protein